MKRSLNWFSGLPVVLALTACGAAGGPDDNPLSNNPLAQACGFVCPGDKIDGVVLSGITEGNASISGIAPVDSFFSAVLSFESAANGVSGGIKEQLDAIRADFGIDGDLAAGLKTQIEANVQGELSIDYEPAECVVDAQATLAASAKCDATVTGGKAEVECKGSCEAEVSANVSCDAKADVYCTATAAEAHCDGECRGTCTATLPSCSGTCKGECSGNCSSYIKNTQGELVCNGSCDATCTGSCETEAAGVACEGTCRGECTFKPPTATCTGALRAECRAQADASFTCSGRCTGDFEPPMVSAECEASVKAQASVNVECRPPRLDVHYGLKATASVRFKSALTALATVRLPALLTALGKGKLVAKAGEGLKVAAGGAVKGAIDASRAKISFKTLNGIGCALEQLPKAVAVVEDAASDLSGELSASASVAAALGIGG